MGGIAYGAAKAAVMHICKVLAVELSAKGALRAVLNSGYRKGGSIMRVMGKRRKRFSTFAPVAVASIGALTLPLMSYGRSSLIVSLAWVGLLLRVYHEAMLEKRGSATVRNRAVSNGDDE